MDLRTKYMGLQLEHPVVASASPLSKETDGVKRLEDAGASAIVMFSLFEEQIRAERDSLEHLTQVTSDSYGEALTYFPPVESFRVGPQRYLELVRRAREAVRVPVIASLNGVSNEGWVDYARQLHQAGASGIELNVYWIATDLGMTGREVEQRYVDILRAVKAAVPIPVAMKLSPYFSSFGNLALQLDVAGADALVLFNRFYQPDFDLEKLEVVPNLELSTPAEIRLPLLWTAVLHGRVRASLGATTGVHGPAEVVKYLLAGADAVMTTSALLRRGPAHLHTLVQGLRDWMQQHRYESVEAMKGAMSQRKVEKPDAFERANYVRVLEGYRNPFPSGG